MNENEEGEDSGLVNRTQRRLLRRLYNGRTVPVIADGRSFLTYKEAMRHLQSLAPDRLDTVYAEMKAFSRSGKD